MAFRLTRQENGLSPSDALREAEMRVAVRIAKTGLILAFKEIAEVSHSLFPVEEGSRNV